MSILASFGKFEACGRIVLPDRSLLIGQKLVETAKIQNSNATFCVIFKQCESGRESSSSFQPFQISRIAFGWWHNRAEKRREEPTMQHIWKGIKRKYFPRQTFGFLFLFCMQYWRSFYEFFTILAAFYSCKGQRLAHQQPLSIPSSWELDSYCPRSTSCFFFLSLLT